MTRLHWKIILKWVHLMKEVDTKNPGFFLWTEGVIKDHWINVLISLIKHKCQRLYEEHTARTGEGNNPIHPAQQIRQRREQQFEGVDEYNCTVDPRTRWRFYPSHSQGHLSRPAPSSSSTIESTITIGSRIKVGILGEPHLGLNSKLFFPVQAVISLARNIISWQSTASVSVYTCRTPHCNMHSHCTPLRTIITRVTLGSSHQVLCLAKHSHFISAGPCPMLWRTLHQALALRPLLIWFLVP